MVELFSLELSDSQPVEKLRRYERLRSVVPGCCRRSGPPICRGVASERPSLPLSAERRGVRSTLGNDPSSPTCLLSPLTRRSSSTNNGTTRQIEQPRGLEFAKFVNVPSCQTLEPLILFVYSSAPGLLLWQPDPPSTTSTPTFALQPQK
jgi:hypothetical protein